MEQFRVYLDELWEWNQQINLIGMDTRKRVVMELFLDSLIPVPYLPVKGKMLDVGSGAGLPGLPLKIYLPDYDLHIVESNAKKVGFLKQVVRILGLKKVLVHHGRIEERGSDLFQDGYNVVAAKALAPFKKTITLCAPFVVPGGLLVGFLGSGSGATLESAKTEMGEQGMSLINKMPYQIPGKGERRWICFMRKGG
jgi:16S rRNA (guanine527-N7)-methyltransferase